MTRYDPNGKVLGSTAMGVELRVEDKGASHLMSPRSVVVQLDLH